MLLELDQITVAYSRRSVPVLRSLSLSLEEGTSVAILGPSGAGKTTLLAAIGQLVRPASGRISFMNAPVSSEHAARRLRADVSWILQSPSVFPRRTALQNVMSGPQAANLNHTSSLSRAINLLDRLALLPLADRAVRQLSGGEAQRVCVARAIAADRRIILADEPTGQLDSVSSRTVAQLLTTARRPDSSLVLVTHDNAIAAFCDQVYVMCDGMVERSK